MKSVQEEIKLGMMSERREGRGESRSRSLELFQHAVQISSDGLSSGAGGGGRGGAL
jgi:hypothetical protein